MLNHPTGFFSGDYNSPLRGCWPLKFLHTVQLPKMYFKSYLGHRAASCWALPHISSWSVLCSLPAIKFSRNGVPPPEIVVPPPRSVTIWGKSLKLLPPEA